MKNNILLSLTLLFSMTLGHFGLKASEEIINIEETRNDTNENSLYYDSDESEGETEEEEKIYHLKFKNEKFEVSEKNLKEIKGIWEVLQAWLEDNEEETSENNPINLTSMMDNKTKKKDIKRFFNLTAELTDDYFSKNLYGSLMIGLSPENLLSQIKIANKLNNQLLIDACSEKSIDMISDEYTEKDAQFVQKIIDELPKHLCDLALKPLLEKKFINKNKHKKPFLNLQIFEGHTDKIISVIKLDDNQIASASWKALKRWNLTTGECIKTFKGHTSKVKSVCKMDNNLIAVPPWVNTLHLRNLRNLPTDECIRTKGHIWPITNEIRIDDNRIISLCNNTLELRNIKEFEKLTFKELVFIITLQKNYELQKTAINIENGTEEYDLLRRLPEALQRKSVELGWVKPSIKEQIKKQIKNLFLNEGFQSFILASTVFAPVVGMYLLERWKKDN